MFGFVGAYPPSNGAADGFVSCHYFPCFVQRRLGLSQPVWLPRSILQEIRRPSFCYGVPLLHKPDHRLCEGEKLTGVGTIGCASAAACPVNCSSWACQPFNGYPSAYYFGFNNQANANECRWSDDPTSGYARCFYDVTTGVKLNGVGTIGCPDHATCA
ncbi:hypothetical protein M407DRAFT_11540 [Tulasnella calospora MUT 4182]|uniref:Uncharacterized protein n=1 Tax=Tulasnella calospora MUT 4182 TaxID=1051891 RepID=A0A0C3Q619_9AGAM|nr:hypothetical protein M407DRAFT_11540 [Tulasnella calospora MUT 4182]